MAWAILLDASQERLLFGCTSWILLSDSGRWLLIYCCLSESLLDILENVRTADLNERFVSATHKDHIFSVEMLEDSIA